MEKLYESSDAPLDFSWHQHIFTENQETKKYRHKLDFGTSFLILWTFLEFLTFLEYFEIKNMLL